MNSITTTTVQRSCALVLFCLGIFLMFGLPAHAEGEPEYVDFGLKKSANTGLLPGSNRQEVQTVQTAIGTITGSILTFVGVIFLLLMIYAGFLWMTGSRSGKDDDINKAKKIITWAITGLAVIFLSYTIVSFIIRVAEQAPNPPSVTPTGVDDIGNPLGNAG